MRDSSALELVLDAAEGCGATLAELAKRLVAAGHQAERARAYVDDLATRQVLVGDVGLRVTGGDAVYGLANAVPQLALARDALAALDSAGIGLPRRHYEDVAAQLDGLPVETKLERLFQVDMTKPVERAVLSGELVGEILSGALLLRRIGPREDAETAMTRFAQRLESRFEDEAVPLLEALDPDLGVGFETVSAPSPLLKGLDGPRKTRDSRWTTREDHLLARLQEVRRDGAEELVLGGADLEQLEMPYAPRLPDAFDVMAAVAAPSPAALESGRFRVLVLGAGGPSGARLLGRFCHADPTLREAVGRHLEAEEALDREALYAEIVHLPRARDVNVVARPVLREYEIECPSGSGAPPDRRIPLTDLLVSARDGQIVLWSRRLGRRVVPRLTNAHNFADRGVAAYRFLCALQASAAFGRFWGPLESAPSLPRVRVGRVVLALASWRLEAERVRRKNAASAVASWRREHAVPRFVALVNFGGQLPVDLENALAVDALVQTVRAQGEVRLVELFPPPDELVVRGPEGSFMHGSSCRSCAELR